MGRKDNPEDNMELTEKDDDNDDTPNAAEVLAETTGKSVDEFAPDLDEYPHPHPTEVHTRDLRDSE